MFYVLPSILFFYRSQFTSDRNKKRQTENEGTIKTRQVKFPIIFAFRNHIVLVRRLLYSSNILQRRIRAINCGIVNYNDLFAMNGSYRC